MSKFTKLELGIMQALWDSGPSNNVSCLQRFPSLPHIQTSELPDRLD